MVIVTKRYLPSEQDEIIRMDKLCKCIFPQYFHLINAFVMERSKN